MGISFCLLVSQPIAFLLLKTNNLRDNQIPCEKKALVLLDSSKHLKFKDHAVLSNKKYIV